MILLVSCTDVYIPLQALCAKMMIPRILDVEVFIVNDFILVLSGLSSKRIQNFTTDMT